MRHASARRAVASGEPISEDVRRHLSECDGCAAFAARVDAVVGAAPSLAPAPPADLADRTIAALATAAARRPHAAGPAPAAVAPVALATPTEVDEPTAELAQTSAQAPPRAGRLLLRGIAAAAAVALVAAGTVRIARSGAERPAREVLLAAAGQARSLDTARLTIRGEYEVLVVLPEIPMPDPIVPQLPPVDPLPSIPQLQVPDMPGLPEDVRRRMQEQQRRMQEGIRPVTPSITAPTIPPFPEIPRESSWSSSYSGTGELVRPDRLHFVVDNVHGEPERGEGAPGHFEFTAVGDRAWMRLPDGPWVEVPHTFGPVAPALFDADALPDVLRRSAADARDLGVERIDGVDVRRLQISLGAGGFDGATTGEAHESVEHVVDVWIGVDDDVVRRVRATSSGTAGNVDLSRAESGARWRSTVTIDLHDIGADVVVEPPPPGEVTGSWTFAAPSFPLLLVPSPVMPLAWTDAPPAG